jgi:hypothetical protein
MPWSSATKASRCSRVSENARAKAMRCCSICAIPAFSSAPCSFGLYRLLTIKRPAERIDDATEQPRPDRDPDDLTGPRHPRSRLDGLAVVEQDGTDRVGIEGQCEAHSPPVEAKELAEAGVRQAGDESDPVADTFHAPYRLGLRREIDAGDGLAAALEPRVVESVRQRLCHDEPTRI